MSITAKELDRRGDLAAQIAALKAQLKPLEDEVKTINRKAIDYLNSANKKTTKRGGWRVSLVAKAGRQSWQKLAMQWKPANVAIPAVPETFSLVVTED